ncbi:VOC family protein [Microbacterium sp.]|uniref:VOC family protein n=1 Tax=Microbacterium sp. TaxID=51671 RepID=UPI003561EDF2
MTVNGPSFISIQVRDIQASAEFYETHLGFTRIAGPPNAVVFDTRPVSFAVREPAADFDPARTPAPSGGVAVWMHATDIQQIHDSLAAAGAEIVAAPFVSPFGLTFTFADPDGYRITLHDQA